MNFQNQETICAYEFQEKQEYIWKLHAVLFHNSYPMKWIRWYMELVCRNIKLRILPPRWLSSPKYNYEFYKTLRRLITRKHVPNPIILSQTVDPGYSFPFSFSFEKKLWIHHNHLHVAIKNCTHTMVDGEDDSFWWTILVSLFFFACVF